MEMVVAGRVSTATLDWSEIIKWGDCLLAGLLKTDFFKNFLEMCSMAQWSNAYFLVPIGTFFWIQDHYLSLPLRDSKCIEFFLYSPSSKYSTYDFRRRFEISERFQFQFTWYQDAPHFFSRSHTTPEIVDWCELGRNKCGINLGKKCGVKKKRGVK